MQFTSSTFLTLLTTALTFITVPVTAQPPAPAVLNYDRHYDDPTALLTTTACSADYGILQGYKTFGSIPNFPYIGGSFLIEGYNSTRCGACYEILYNRADGTQVVKPFTIINQASENEFVLSLKGELDLTGLPGVESIPGDVVISYKEVPSYDCGFPTL